MNLGKPKQKRLWQQIVIRKIENQSACLRFLNLEGAEELLKIAEVIAPEEALLKSLQEAEEDFEKGNYYTHQDVLENSKNRFLSKYGN